MNERDISGLVGKVHAYSCGFPCKPPLNCKLHCSFCGVDSFLCLLIRHSLLNNQRPGMKGKESGIFFRSLETIAQVEPAVGVLENVLGIRALAYIEFV